MITLYFLKVKLSGHVHLNSLKRRCNGVRVLAFFFLDQEIKIEKDATSTQPHSDFCIKP